MLNHLRSNYLLVIAFADTSSQPNAMVIELKDAIVANVTMTSSWRPKYETGLAKFELERHGRMCLTNLRVLYPRSLWDICIFAGQVTSFNVPSSSRHNSRISTRSDHHKNTCPKLEVPHNKKSNFPTIIFMPVELQTAQVISLFSYLYCKYSEQNHRNIDQG